VKRNKVRLAGAVLATMTLFLVHARQASAQAAQMAGAWALEVNIDGSVTTPSLTLVQQGTALTGHYSSPSLGEADVTGTVDGRNVTVTFNADPGLGMPVAVTYAGAVDAQGVWSGTFDLGGGLASGTFTGKKAPPPN
jgi:hypothetical protein